MTYDHSEGQKCQLESKYVPHFSKKNLKKICVPFDPQWDQPKLLIKMGCQNVAWPHPTRGRGFQSKTSWSLSKYQSVTPPGAG